MTKPELAALLDARTQALACPRRQVPWNRLTPAERAGEEAILRVVAQSERAILDHLLEAPGPVRVGDVVLNLTADRLSFLELDPMTGKPFWMSTTGLKQSAWQNWLYRYPERATA